MLAYHLNDNLLRGTRLRTVNLTTGLEEYLTGAATVTVTVLDSAGVAVTGETWPLALTYIAGSQGGFLGVLRNELAWTAGDLCTAVVVVDAGADQHGEFTLPLQVLQRGV